MNQNTIINPEDDLDGFMRDETPRERAARWAFAIGASLAINAAMCMGINAMTHGRLFSVLFA